MEEVHKGAVKWDDGTKEEACDDDPEAPKEESDNDPEAPKEEDGDRGDVELYYLCFR